MATTYDGPTNFTVSGRGNFPIDMLRHDHCWPVDGDMLAIQERRSHPTEIVFRTYSWRGITPERWRSFGWVVTRINALED